MGFADRFVALANTKIKKGTPIRYTGTHKYIFVYLNTTKDLHNLGCAETTEEPAKKWQVYVKD